MMRSAAAVVLAAVAVLVLARPLKAKTDLNVDLDKTFSFADARTWAWHPEGAGDVRLAISQNSDPKRIAAKVDPVLIPAIEREMQARGFSKAEGGPADLNAHYYMLATVGSSAQYMGQFVAPLPEWGLPPFAPMTQSLAIYPVGTLIIDLTAPARGAGAIVWRGSAQREISLERSADERKAVLEKAVRDLIKKVPQPKKKS